MIPHLDALGVPGVVLAAGVPAGDVDIVHAAVVEWRALGLVAFAGHVAGRHVADADDGKIADLAFLDEVDDFLVVPGVAIEEVHRNHLARSLDAA